MRPGTLRFEELYIAVFSFIGMLTVAVFVLSAVSGVVMSALQIQLEQFVRYGFAFVAGLIVGLLAVTVLLTKEGDSA